MISKGIDICLLILVLFLSIQSQCVVLNFNKNHSTITFFTPSQQTLVLQIDYSSSDIHLPKILNSHKLDFVYLSKHSKNKLILNPHQNQNSQKHQNIQKLSSRVIYDFQQKQVQFSDGRVIKISGKVGLNPQNNLFLYLLKSSAHKQSVNIYYNTQKQSLQVLYESCHNILKFPISTKLFYEEKQKIISIRDLSQSLKIDKNTVEFLFSQNGDNIVTIGIDEVLSKQVEVIINGHSKNIPLMEFFKPFCHKKAHTHNYTCDFRHFEREDPQINGLLMYYDFSICVDGIQIHSQNSQNQQTYYILHCVLLFFIVIACGIYSQEEFVVKWIKKILKKKRYY